MNHIKRTLLSILANVHMYFGLCLIYFAILEIRSVKFIPIGETIYDVMYNYFVPIFIGIPLVIFFFVKKDNIIRRNIIVISMVALTIIIFELVLIV